MIQKKSFILGYKAEAFTPWIEKCFYVVALKLEKLKAFYTKKKKTFQKTLLKSKYDAKHIRNIVYVYCLGLIKVLQWDRNKCIYIYIYIYSYIKNRYRRFFWKSTQHAVILFMMLCIVFIIIEPDRHVIIKTAIVDRTIYICHVLKPYNNQTLSSTCLLFMYMYHDYCYYYQCCLIQTVRVLYWFVKFGHICFQFH
jgi:hypothetical protein